MSVRNRSLLPHKVLTVVLAALLVSLLVSQAVSLFVFPVPDSIRWFGDESWLMTESIELASTGELRHPHALGSTLAEPKSFVLLGFPWLRAITYGIPAAIAFPANPVDVGRIVTLSFSLIVVGVLMVLIYRRTREMHLALIYGIALLLCDAHVFASHSARPDILVGLIVLLFGDILSRRPARPLLYWFVIGFSALALAIGLPVHLYLLLFSMCAVAFFIHGSFRNRKAWFGSVAGVLAALTMCSLLQLAISGDVSLTATEHTAEVSDVSRDVPLLKLFSFSAQRAVFIKHFEQLRFEGELLFLFIPFLVLALWWRRRDLSTDRDAITLMLAFVAMFVWYFLQRPHPAYLAHVLPLVIFATTLQVHWFNRAVLRRAFSIIIVLFVPLSLIGAYVAYGNGLTWSVGTDQNVGMEGAVRSLRPMIVQEGSAKPLVLVEASATKPLLNDTSIRLMTTHFQFFPSQRLTTPQALQTYDADYCLIFNTPYYGYDRNAIDPLVHAIKTNGDLVGFEVGEMFDIGRNYFWTDKEYDPDTLFLYKLRK